MPISYILAWPMGTQAGNTTFLNSKVNALLQKILNNWAAFLLSSSSRSTLTDDKDGWFGEDAMSAMPSLGTITYHRWHSSVSGVIRKAYLVPGAGAYYAENLAQGFDATGPDKSLAYITQVNTRAVIFIDADNPSIGLLCFLGVGMCEFSSCEIGLGAQTLPMNSAMGFVKG